MEETTSLFTSEEFWEIVNRIASILQIIGLPLLGIGFYQIYKDYSFRKKIGESFLQIGDLMPKGFAERQVFAAKVNTPNPVAVAMCLLPNSRTLSIKEEVAGYLKLLGGEFAKMPVVEFNSDGVDKDELGQFITVLKKARTELDVMQATEIHLFIAGPITSGLLIGSQFDNWKPVKIYAKNMTTRQYEFWCLLEK